jgi:hypothetical protein
MNIELKRSPSHENKWDGVVENEEVTEKWVKAEGRQVEPTKFDFPSWLNGQNEGE